MKVWIYILIGLALLGLSGGLILFLIKRNQAEADAALREILPDEPVLPVDSGGVLACEKSLSFGDRGPEVQALQQWFNGNKPLFARPIVVDGIWGAQTQGAIRNIMQLGESVRLIDLENSPCQWGS
ncbi:MAG: hypothetical protein AAF206_14735 [Bacteroidota bacterium]